MVDLLKNIFYFPIAWYFRFFATIRLRRWNPKVIVVTGSNGKTTLFNMLEAQIGDKAKYSHHANSGYGIPFDILNLHRKSLLSSEWVELFLKAPLNAFKNPPREKIYVVEADVDRPYEGKFLAKLLRPEIVLWVSTARTHSMNFDNLVASGQFSNVEEAIAYEYGYFLENCRRLAVINGDSILQKQQLERINAEVKEIVRENLFKKYEVTVNGTQFLINDHKYIFKDLLPEEIFYSIEMCRITVEYLNLSFDIKFSNFALPSGRGSIFEGIKDTTIIDSTYNANLSSNEAMLKMYSIFPAKKKWVVISDMLELGNEEKEEHEKLAEILSKMNLNKIILVGIRTAKYTFEKLKMHNVISFNSSKEVKDYLNENIKGGETILFKGSQSMFLEGVVESLLKNKSDSKDLPRRGEFWENKRKRAGL